MRTHEEHRCPNQSEVRLSSRSVIRSVDGGGPSIWLPWDAAKPGAVLKAKAPPPVRHSTESCCRLRTVSGGEGPKRGVGSEGLAISEDMERPELANAARESSYVLSSGFHQRAYDLQDTALGRPSQRGIRAIQHRGLDFRAISITRPGLKKIRARGTGA
jgi:hypothetical protein